MKQQDLTEMEWLAASLMSTAARLTRAVALLRAAGDLERLQAKLAAVVAPPVVTTGVVTPPVHQPPGSVVEPPRSPVAPARPLAGKPANAATGSSRERVASCFAVFDAESVPGVKSAKMSAGLRPPF